MQPTVQAIQQRWIKTGEKLLVTNSQVIVIIMLIGDEVVKLRHFASLPARVPIFPLLESF